MKKLLCAVLCTATLLSALPVQAASGDQTTIEQVVGALGIITGDENGNLNLSAGVTRAEFAKMLVCASTLKDTVSPAGNASPFRDVPYTHWAASYIKTAVGQGWLTGYLDGSYRPDNNVTTAEAATAVLKLLGYAATDFSGAYPEGQMALYKSLGLGDGISSSATGTMSRQNCMRLFYNLLSVKSKDSEQKYIEKLGYKLDGDGNPDYNDLLQGTMDGPVVVGAEGWQAALGFTPSTVYRNGSVSSADALQAYDVLYYSAERRTVWAYARRVTGTYEKASPNKEAPTSVTVAGVEYTVSGSMATAALGTEGGLAIGSNITLLLGKNGEAVMAYPSSDLASDLVGVVTAKGTQEYTSANGASYTSQTITLTAPDGESYTVACNKTGIGVGSLVRVTYDSSGTNVTTLTRSGSVSGKVSASAGRIGNTKVADGADIMDAGDTGGVRIYLSRIDGMTLDSSDVAYAEKNSAGEITTLILNDVTGDQYSYGVVLSASEKSDGMSVSGSYRWLIDGVQTSQSSSSSTLGASSGPARFTMSGNSVQAVRKLEKVKTVAALTAGYVQDGEGERHTIWDHAVVYLLQNNTYSKMDRNELNLADYNVSAYYDKDDAEGGRVRVLIATVRS
ncbi:S-layer homology domain-containing protein [Intestinibacillus massiliensis]|nr:S-layer homology domain-containing protein [Intestinibacillus massiliensis]